MEKTKEVAILGGTFNPPSMAHIQVACEVYNQCDSVDEVWLMPCGDGRSDKKINNDAATRLKMLSLIKEDIVFDDMPIFVSDFEAKRGYTPTYTLLKELEKAYPTVNFHFCIGTDLVNSLPLWDFGDKLVSETSFIIMNRPNYEPTCEFPGKCKVINTNFDGSSTQLRKRINNAFKGEKEAVIRGITGLKSKSVISFILENKLFGIEAN